MSDIWIRKMKTYFRILDFDADGVVSRKDFERMVEAFIAVEKFPPGQIKKTRQHVSDLFTLYTKAAGTTKDVLLTEDLLIKSVMMQREDPAFKKGLNDALLVLFIGMDVNQNGSFSYDEYRRIYENLGFVDTSFTKAAFATIDTDHDGRVSFEEYLAAAYDYMCSDDENTTAMFGLIV